MKILYIADYTADYGVAMLYEGLCQVVGYENVIDHPVNPMFHAHQIWRFQTPYPEPIFSEDYDFVVCTSPRDDCVKWTLELEHKAPIVFVDMGDGLEYNTHADELLNPACSFSREFIHHLRYPDYCYPLSLASLFPIVEPERDREWDVFISWTSRYNFIRPFIEEKLKSFHTRGVKVCISQFIGWDQYYSELCNSRIGINVPGSGSGFGVRFFELLSAGCCVLALESPCLFQFPFYHNEHVSFFGPNTFDWQFEHVFSDESERLRIANGGQRHLVEHYTVKKMAEYFLETVRNHL